MRPLDICFALTVIVFWGGNFVAAKIGLAHFPPVFLTTLRFTSVALLLIPFVKKPPKSQMRAIGQMSIINTLHFSLPYIAMSQGLSIASTAITTQLGVPFSCLLGALFLKDRLGPWRIGGMVVAFLGMTIVFGAPNVLEHRIGFLCALAAAFFWGSSNILIKRVKSVPMLSSLAWMSLFSVPQLYLISLIVEPGAWRSLLDAPAAPLLGLAYTVVLSTLVAYSLWFSLLQKHPVTQVAPYSLLTPVLGSLFGLLFFGEIITWHVIVGGMITLAGIAVIVLRRPKHALLDEPA